MIRFSRDALLLTLSAPAGTIYVTSVASTGEVPIDPTNSAALTATRFGAAGMKGSSTLDVSDPKNLGSGSSVFIRAGALTISASDQRRQLRRCRRRPAGAARR